MWITPLRRTEGSLDLKIADFGCTKSTVQLPDGKKDSSEKGRLGESMDVVRKSWWGKISKEVLSTRRVL